MTYSIKNKIAEHKTLFQELLLNSENILISSPTDSGKTYSIVEFSKNYPDKRIAFLMPVRTLVDNIKEKYQGKEGSQIRCGYGLNFYYENSNARFICTTYDSFQYFNNSFDLVVIDEAHILAGHGSFRTETIARLFNTNSKTVLLSGTPEIIEHLKGFKKYEFVRKSIKKSVDIIVSKYSSKRHAFNLINEHKGNSVLMVRVNNKNILDALHEEFKNCKNIVKVYSDSDNILFEGQDIEQVEQMRRGIVPEGVEVILCTSIFDAGISFQVNSDIQCYAIEDNYIPNAIDMIQLMARVRSGDKYKMSLTVVGTFGDYELRNTIDLSNEPTTKQMVKQMSHYYSEYSELDEESYISILNYYGIRADIKLPNEININNPKYACKLKPIQIVRNFHNFPAFYDRLTSKLNANGQSTSVELITGVETIHSNPNSAINRINEQLLTASDYCIPFHYFISDTYNSKRLVNLIGAVDKYNNSGEFEDIIHSLLECSEIAEGDKTKFDLSNYHELDDSSQAYFREVARLFFEDVKIQKGRNSVTLKRLPHSTTFDMYLNRFYKYFVKKVA